jgi:hypothetical protein
MKTTIKYLFILAVGVSVGYFIGAAEAAQIILGANH